MYDVYEGLTFLCEVVCITIYPLVSNIYQENRKFAAIIFRLPVNKWIEVNFGK